MWFCYFCHYYPAEHLSWSIADKEKRRGHWICRPESSSAKETLSRDSTLHGVKASSNGHRKGRGSANQLLIYPTFHFRKLGVAKTCKKIYGSNNCWHFINTAQGAPHVAIAINRGTWRCPGILLWHLKQSAHTLQTFLLHNMASTFPTVRTLSHLYHVYKRLPQLPELTFMDVCHFSFQLLWLLRENLKLTDVILRMLIRIIITELSCKQ